MDDSPQARPSLTRRTALRSVAGLAAGGVCVTAASADARTATVSPTVLTQNAYVGVDLTRLLDARSLDDVRRIAGDFIDQVDPARYEARAGAIASAIVSADADVVALQEVATVRTGAARGTDSGGTTTERSGAVLADFLAGIRSALSDRGADYEVAAEAVSTEIELPTGSEEAAREVVRLTDRDVLLVRGDHGVRASETGRYDAGLSLPILGTDFEFSLRRGYGLADVAVNGVGFTAVSTHLESVSGSIRRQQAGELLDALPADGPVVVGGDFNSGPGGPTRTYDHLTSSLNDAYAALRPDADGYTCCQAADLRNDRSRLSRRIDAVLYRGEVSPTGVRRVGHEPEDRVAVERDGETVRLWPSDHAGVVATLDVTGERTATASSRATASETTARGSAATDRQPTAGTGATPTGTSGSRSGPRSGAPATDDGSADASGDAGPGFGVVAGLLGLAAGLGLHSRRE